MRQKKSGRTNRGNIRESQPTSRTNRGQYGGSQFPAQYGTPVSLISPSGMPIAQGIGLRASWLYSAPFGENKPGLWLFCGGPPAAIQLCVREFGGRVWRAQCGVGGLGGGGQGLSGAEQPRAVRPHSSASFHPLAALLPPVAAGLRCQYLLHCCFSSAFTFAMAPPNKPGCEKRAGELNLANSISQVVFTMPLL